MTQRSAEQKRLDDAIAVALVPLERRLAALEAAPRLALRYVAKAVDSRTETTTIGAFESEQEGRDAIAALEKAPPRGCIAIHSSSIYPEIVVMFGDVVQVVALGEVIAGGVK